MKNIELKAWKFGLALFNEKSEEVMSINEIVDNESYYYVVGENMFKTLKDCFLTFLNESNYKPINVDLEEMARQVTVHYVACIENEPEDWYIDTIVSFNSVEESAKWFWENGTVELEEYDAEI